AKRVRATRVPFHRPLHRDMEGNAPLDVAVQRFYPFGGGGGEVSASLPAGFLRGARGGVGAAVSAPSGLRRARYSGISTPPMSFMTCIMGGMTRAMLCRK